MARDPLGVAVGVGLALMVGLAGSSLASAQPMDTYGMGSRSIGLGGAVTADVEDFSANYYNPAGVVRSPTLQVGFGWFYAHHDFSIDGVDSQVDPVHGIVFGLNVPGNIDDFRFAFGLGLHLNDQRVSRSRTLPRTRPRWELYNSRPQRVFLSANASIEPVEWLRLGGGITFLSFAEVDLRIRGTLDLAAPERGSELEHDLFANLITIRAPQAGIQVQPTEWLDFGVVYRGEMVLSGEIAGEVGTVDGTGDNALVIRAGDLLVPAYLRLFSQSTSAYLPHQFSFGGSVRPIEGLRISAELTWLIWSLYQGPIGTTEVAIDIDVPPELADSIVIPPLTPSRPAAANFSDRVVPRIGIEWAALDNPDLGFDVRAGYFYESSPAPEQTGRFNLVDNDRHAWSLGAGIELRSLRPLLPGSLRFDIHAQYAFVPERSHRKTNPIDPIGDYVSQGQIFAGGITMGVRFE